MHDLPLSSYVAAVDGRRVVERFRFRLERSERSQLSRDRLVVFRFFDFGLHYGRPKRKVTKVKLLIICLALSWSGSTYADMPLSVYQQSKDALFVKSYVTGVGRGMFWLNAAAGMYHKISLFCVPPKVALDEAIIHSLLEQEIHAPAGGKSYEPDVKIELILYNAFVSRFPCQK
jgi:hypothetical protein